MRVVRAMRVMRAVRVMRVVNFPLMGAYLTMKMYCKNVAHGQIDRVPNVRAHSMTYMFRKDIFAYKSATWCWNFARFGTMVYHCMGNISAIHLHCRFLFVSELRYKIVILLHLAPPCGHMHWVTSSSFKGLDVSFEGLHFCNTFPLTILLS